MPDDGGGSVRECEESDVGMIPFVKEVSGKESLEDVDDENRNCGAPAEHAVGVGCAQVAAAVLAKINTSDSPDDVARRECAGQIRRNQKYDDCYDSSVSFLRDFNRIRTGEPMKPHASRNP
jgi:hypothetical protein